jgi:hypothetical protein
MTVPPFYGSVARRSFKIVSKTVEMQLGLTTPFAATLDAAEGVFVFLLITSDDLSFGLRSGSA